MGRTGGPEEASLLVTVLITNTVCDRLVAMVDKVAKIRPETAWQCSDDYQGCCSGGEGAV